MTSKSSRYTIHVMISCWFGTIHAMRKIFHLSNARSAKLVLRRLSYNLVININREEAE